MPAETSGSVYETRTGYGIRWPEDGGAAAPLRLRDQDRGAPLVRRATSRRGSDAAPRPPRSPSTPSATCSSSGTAPRSRAATRRRSRSGSRLPRGVRHLDAARARGRRRRRRRLAGRRSPTTARYRLTSALRQALAAAVRWRYIARNPAVDAGRNPQPRAEELHPFTPRARSTRSPPSSAAATGRSSCSPPRRGCGRTSGSALERRDVDRAGRGRGGAAPLRRRRRSRRYPKTAAVAAAGAAHRRARWPRSTRCRRGSTRRCCSRPRRAATSTSTTGGRASGIRRSRRPGSPSAARTTCATRSRPRRSPPASRPSSWPG